MNKTKPTLARQTFEKVCAIETILNSLLADSSPPVSGPPVSERPLYLATAGPEMPLSVIRLEDAPDYLPCFDEADLLYGIPGLPILMSYCPEQVMDIGRNLISSAPWSFSASIGTAAPSPFRWLTCISWRNFWKSTASS